MSESADLRPLFAAYAHGDLSAEQLQTLEAALRQNSNLRREFIEYMNIDSALGDLAALSADELEDIESEHEPTERVVADSDSIGGADNRLGLSYRLALIVGTLAATLLIAGILWLARPDANEGAAVATLVTNVGAKLSWDGRPWRNAALRNAELRSGEYRLDHGLLHLRLTSGVMVYVEAPARFDAVSSKRFVLHGGRLSASVPPEGVGFTVETPEAEVIDFGTEFSVEVRSGASEVHVFDGLVRVQPRAAKDGEAAEAVDLRTDQAVKIEGASEKPVNIELARDRFIRTFEEPKRSYPRSVKRLSPAAYYRMAIRDKGLAAEPARYSGVVLTGDGRRPPHASGVFAGGSLRVQADSTGRGGRVDSPPPLVTGRFTLAVVVYLETQTPGGTVATNFGGDEGSFSLALDKDGLLQATIRNRDGDLQSATCDSMLPLKTWVQCVVTADGEHLRIYADGQLAASAPCGLLAPSESDIVWFGTDADGHGLWNGRIDELVMFDRALSSQDITALYQAALDEMAKSK